jgi:hypothetical protein
VNRQLDYQVENLPPRMLAATATTVLAMHIFLAAGCLILVMHLPNSDGRGYWGLLAAFTMVCATVWRIITYANWLAGDDAAA